MVVLGTTLWFTGSWKDKDGNPSDVTTISLIVTDGRGVDRTPAGGITPTWTGVGEYIADFLIDEDGDKGVWLITWFASIDEKIGVARTTFEVMALS